MGMTFDVRAYPRERYARGIADGSFSTEETGCVRFGTNTTFDRECLSTWCGEGGGGKWVDYDLFLPTPAGISRAIRTLVDLEERVRRMPFDTGFDCNGVSGAGTIDPETIDAAGYTAYAGARYVYGVNLFTGAPYGQCYYGTPDNVAIYREVEAVLEKPYHFNFPWERKAHYSVVRNMIDVLRDVEEFMRVVGDAYTVIAWYY